MVKKLFLHIIWYYVIYTHAYIHTTYIPIHIYTHHTCTWTHIHMHTYIYTTCTHSYMHTYTHTHIQHTKTHTHVYTHIPTHTHTQDKSHTPRLVIRVPLELDSLHLANSFWAHMLLSGPFSRLLVPAHSLRPWLSLTSLSPALSGCSLHAHSVLSLHESLIWAAPSPERTDKNWSPLDSQQHFTHPAIHAWPKMRAPQSKDMLLCS